MACTPAFRVPDEKALELLLPAPAIGSGESLGAVAVAGPGGGRHAPRLVLVQHEGVPALMVVPGDRPLTALRPVRASLLVTPYLTWSWNVVPAADGSHPLAVVVAFGSRGELPRATGRAAAAAWPPTAGAPTLVVSWDRQGLRRGTLERAPDIGANAFRYTIRGGVQDGGTWWVETVDLGAIYQHAWPDRPLREATVALIGIAVEPGPAEAPAYAAGVALSR